MAFFPILVMSLHTSLDTHMFGGWDDHLMEAIIGPKRSDAERPGSSEIGGNLLLCPEL